MREEFRCYKYIISFSGKTKSKDCWFYGEKKRVIWHGVKGERERFQLSAANVNQDSQGICMWYMSRIAKGVF